MQDMNLFELEGKVLAVRQGKNSLSVLVFMKLTSKCFLSVITSLDTEVSTGDYIRCSGHIASYSYKEAITNKFHQEQHFIADTFSVKKTEMEEKMGIKGMFTDSSFHFRAYILGRLVDLKKHDNGWERLTIQTAMPSDGEDGIDEDDVIARREQEHNASYVICNYKEGRFLKREDLMLNDTLAIVCDIYTPQKEIEGEKVSFKNLIIKDIRNISLAERNKKAEESVAE